MTTPSSLIAVEAATTVLPSGCSAIASMASGPPESSTVLPPVPKPRSMSAGAALAAAGNSRSVRNMGRIRSIRRCCGRTLPCSTRVFSREHPRY
jgi:hypothetical protein